MNPEACMRTLFSATLLFLVGIVSSPAWALDPGTTDPALIMEAVEGRETASNSMLRLAITITDKAGRQRSRLVQVRTLQFDGGSKQLILFEEPADLRNAGFLSIDYSDGNKNDDQWLYLPSLARTTRIASADKSGSFMGTDLTYADMTQKDASQYTYSLVEASADVDGEDCWLIEATPATAKEESETGYVKSHVWVSKTTLLPLQMKSWVTEGKRLKYTKMGDVRNVGGHWVAHQVTVRTTKNGEVESTSTLVTSDLVFDSPDVSDADFTEQRLERGL